MKSNKLEIHTALQIQKPIDEVFDAVIDPAKMSNYFISKSTGPMEESKTIFWEFPEFDISFPVQVKKVVPATSIDFTWEGAKGNDLLVTLTFEKKENDSTLVSITEGSMSNNQEGLDWLKNNTAGWANFLACLKAYLEFGINLRKGGFDYLKA